MANRFPAAFEGECSRCLADRDIGDEIGYDDENELCCSECLDKDDDDMEEHVSNWKVFGEGLGK